MAQPLLAASFRGLGWICALLAGLGVVCWWVPERCSRRLVT